MGDSAMSISPLKEPSCGTQVAAVHLGFWAAFLLAILSAASFALGITTPPRSGPFCAALCIPYPFTDAAQFVPRDYFWFIPGVLLTPVFVVVTACIHSVVPAHNRHLSLIGLCFASIAAGLVSADYFVQFQVVAPSLLRGETSGLALFTQYNPHGLFIALEDLGYLMLCVAFLFAGVALSRGRRLESATRWIFIFSAILGFASFLGITWRFGLQIEYRFEVAIITITWITLLANGVILTFQFRRLARQVSSPNRE